MRISEWSLQFYRLPYSRPVRWFNSVEDGAVFVLLRIVASDGSVGVAEAPLKPTWSSIRARSPGPCAGSPGRSPQVPS